MNSRISASLSQNTNSGFIAAVVFAICLLTALAGLQVAAAPYEVSSAGALASIQQARIQERLDDALEERKPDYNERLALVAEADALLQSGSGAPHLLYLKTRLVEAIANLRLGRFDFSQSQLENLCPIISRADHPALLFRCLSMQAALKLILGDRQASLNAYEELLGNDLTNVPQSLQARARINYAAVLSENGRSAEAADLYEQQMVVALSTGDDPLALYAGNNLVVILITQGDYLAARGTLNQLADVLQRNPNAMVQGSLRLHDLELLRVAGDHTNAIAGLREFIRLEFDPTPLMMGSAHKLLADALRETGELDDALRQANLAIELLEPQVNETTEARLSKAQVLFDMGLYDQVLQELEAIDVEKERVPARRVKVHRLELASLLGQGNRARELAALSDLSDADAARDLLASTTRSEYFEARLIAARRSLELQQAEALTEAALENNRLDRNRRNQTMLLLVIAAFAFCVFAYLLVNRKAERRALLEKEEQNQKLGALVAAKTRELTENLGAQAEMAKALERTKRTEAIGLLAGNVAHDFNNLLQVIASANETLANENSTSSERARVLDISANSLSHASGIIRQLLAYSRQQDLAAHPVRFSDYLKNTEALLRSAAGEENTLIIEDQSNNSGILVDPAQLTTSLLNLISNASDAMIGGGNVVLTADVRLLDESMAARWNDIHPGEFLVLSVTDSGIGMTREQVMRASEPFFTTKSSQFGTGLGLSSVYGFVKQSGGDLEIISAPDEGTMVRILLPLTEERQPIQPAGEKAPLPQLEGKRVLLVEDNESVARVLESVLRQIGLSSTLRLSGEEAQKLLRSDSEFDYVLSDVRMPGAVNGPALARWIRSEYPSINVMLMSGFNELGVEDTDLPLISKPFNIQQLKRFLSEQAQPA